MTRVHSHLHVYTAIPQIFIQNVIIRAVKYGSNQRTTSIKNIYMYLQVPVGTGRYLQVPSTFLWKKQPVSGDRQVPAGTLVLFSENYGRLLGP